ncbi:unnamed protein product [Dracunculus medinensis]|uniref:Glycosyltransferase family 92 protein n=1 Tax=Dracunculus medinensis TaxID=318479 RepID=A0A0N4U7X7_DRAME|nr:unnamed protein product [Dracunculus medinensis]
MVGYFFTLQLPEKISILLTKGSELQFIYVNKLTEVANSQKIFVQDARIKFKKKQHSLAVCLQPIFLLADWTLLVQFFETWIAQGATKFYAYMHSAVPEVDKLLKMYENDPNIAIERIDWAPLPTYDPSASRDPNNRLYRTEAITAINDCVLKARSIAKYVVSSDLDEIIVPLKTTSLLTLLDEFTKKHRNIAAMIIRSSYAYWQVIITPRKLLSFWIIFDYLKILNYIDIIQTDCKFKLQSGFFF